MKTYTNHTPGLRGITVNSENGPYMKWLEPGQSVKLDPDDVIAAPELGTKADAQNDGAADQLAALEAENAELKKQIEDQAAQLTKLTADLEKATAPKK
jgi:hypothetical protein